MGLFKLKVLLLALVFFSFTNEHKGFAQAKLEVEKFSGITNISGKIIDVKEDTRGNLWILTSLQVHKYNPAGSESFSKFSGLPSDVGLLNSLFIGAEDQVWISSDNGLVKYEPEANSFSRLSTNGVKIRQITGDRSGALWLATNEGIWVSNGKELSFVAGFPEEQIVNDLHKAENQVLIATSRGFFSLTLNGTMRSVPLPGYESIDIKTIYFNGSSYLLGTQRDGLLKLSADFTKLQKIYSLPYPARQLPLTGITADKAGNIYVSTLGEGLVVLDSDLNLISHLKKDNGRTAFLDDQLTGLFLDKFNRLWIPTESGGFYSINLKQQVFDLVQNETGKYSSLAHNFTTAIEEDANGNLWFGTKEGLSVWNRQSNSWQHLRNLSFSRRLPNPDVVRDLHSSGEHMWVATYNDGIYKVNIHTLLRAHYSVDARNKINLQKVNAVQLDHQNNIWAAGEEGNLVQIKSNGEIEEFPFQDINALLTSASGELIAGGKNGIFRIFPETGAIEKISSLSPGLKGLPYLNVNTIRESTTGELLFATEGAGVVVYDPLQDEYQVISDGLPSKSIKTIEIFGRKDVWVGTPNGLSYFSLGGDLATRTFRESSGLASSTFTGSSNLVDNKLIFGTANGVQIFDPLDLKKMDINPPFVAVNELKVRNRSNGPIKLNLDQPLQLNNNENSLSFSFAGAQPGSDDALLYSWRLSGLDESWSEPDAQSRVSFPHLGPGEYIFQVKGLSTDGTWSEVQEVPFKIMAPWWSSSSASFGILSALLAICFFLGFYLRRARKKKEKEAQLSLLASLNQEISTPLNVLLSTLDNIAEEEEVKQKNRLKSATNRLREIMDPIQNLEGSRKARTIEISEIVVEEFFNALHDEVKPLLKEKNLDLILNNQFDSHFFYDKTYLNNIFLNVLSSSIRYCTNDGKIILFLIGTNKGDLKVQVIDNGLGMPEKEKNIAKEYFRSMKGAVPAGAAQLNRLLAVKDFLARSGGDIMFESSRNGGTTFTLILTNHVQPLMVASEKPEDKVHEPLQPKVKVEKLIEPPSEEYTTTGESEPSSNSEEEKVHILIAEEDSELKAETEALKELGQIHEARNLIEAYQMAVDLRPTCIVASAGRPGFDGLVLWKALRNNPDLAAIPVYLIFNNAEHLESAETIKQETLIPVKKANNPRSFVQLLSEKHQIPIDTSFSNRNLAERNSKLLKKDVEEDVILKLQKLIIRNLDESSFSVQELCKAIGVRTAALELVVQDCKGMALDEFIIATKLEYAKNLIIKGDSDLSEVALKAGFKNKDIFFYLYKKHFGFMPGRIIEKN